MYIIYRDGDMLSHEDTFCVLFRRRGQGIVHLALLVGGHNVSEVYRDGVYLKLSGVAFVFDVETFTPATAS